MPIMFLCEWNEWVVVHKTDDAKVYNNTVYENGQVPSEADSDWVSAGNHTYVDNEGSSSSWKTPLAEGNKIFRDRCSLI